MDGILAAILDLPPYLVPSLINEPRNKFSGQNLVILEVLNLHTLHKLMIL